MTGSTARDRPEQSGRSEAVAAETVPAVEPMPAETVPAQAVPAETVAASASRDAANLRVETIWTTATKSRRETLAEGPTPMCFATKMC